MSDSQPTIQSVFANAAGFIYAQTPEGVIPVYVYSPLVSSVMRGNLITPPPLIDNWTENTLSEVQKYLPLPKLEEEQIIEENDLLRSDFRYQDRPASSQYNWQHSTYKGYPLYIIKTGEDQETTGIFEIATVNLTVDSDLFAPGLPLPGPPWGP